MLKLIHIEAEYNEVLQHSLREPVILYKHSSICELCHMAHQELKGLDLPIYKVIVQQARSLSNTIADTLSIHHETPQVIVLHQRKPVFDTSHRRITTPYIQEAVANVIAS